MAEGDDQVAGRRHRSEIGRVDPVQLVAADAAQAGAEPVDLAAGAEAGDGGEQRQEGHQPAERHANASPADRVRHRGGGQDAEPDQVREARRPGVLDRSLTDPRLDPLEVREARQAVAPPEAEADRQLGGQQGEDHPPAGQDGQSAPMPTVAWRKRGARASTTSSSQ